MATLLYCQSWAATLPLQCIVGNSEKCQGCSNNAIPADSAQPLNCGGRVCGMARTTGGTGRRAEDRRAVLHVRPRPRGRAHVPPAGLPLDELDGLEGLVHVADGQVEAEVEHGVAGGPLALLQAHKVPQRSSGHHVRQLPGRTPRRLRLPWRRRRSGVRRPRVRLAGLRTRQTDG